MPYDHSMNSVFAIVGNTGPEVRSDCQVENGIKESGGLK